ncbi:MAG: hypothetical protein QF682_08185 [Candidatus Thermoplasmatota archaeon]|nr:hypothetical protein [Candidatus Thermoplasmatota archaeon]
MVNKRQARKFPEKKINSLHPRLSETVTVIGVGEKGGDALEELRAIPGNPFTASFRYVVAPTSTRGGKKRVNHPQETLWVSPVGNQRFLKVEQNERVCGARQSSSEKQGSKGNTSANFNWEKNTMETVDDGDVLELEYVRSGFSSQSDNGDGGKDEKFANNWLDRTLLGRNPAYTRLRNFDSDMVQWAMEMVKQSDTLFVMSDLTDESLDICLLLDAIANKARRRVIMFLIQSDRYKDIWDVQFLNKRIQEVAMCAAGTMITPPTKFINLRGLPEILLALYGMIQSASTVNIDLADIRNITGFGNIGMMGVGRARGSNRTRKAVRKTLSHNMLDIDLAGIERAIVYVNGGEDMTIEEAESASYYISKEIREGAKIIWGANVTPELNEQIEIVLLVGLTPHQALLHHYAGT